MMMLMMEGHHLMTFDLMNTNTVMGDERRGLIEQLVL